MVLLPEDISSWTIWPQALQRVLRRPDHFTPDVMITSTTVDRAGRGRSGRLSSPPRPATRPSRGSFGRSGRGRSLQGQVLGSRELGGRRREGAGGGGWARAHRAGL